uniref:ferritin-like domain-containing protein n=2 Tax=Bacteria TaxID=2 RepID=UPI0038F7A955
EGLPNLQDLGRLRIGENSEEMINANMSFELDTLDDLKDAIKLAESKKDYISREALDNILNEQEEQIDWLETQQLLIKST